MDFESIVGSIRDGRWLMPISIGILVIAIGVVVAVAWPQIQPGPLSPSPGTSTAVTGADRPKPANAAAEVVPQSIVRQIAEDLGENAAGVSVHWADATRSEIVARTRESALTWREYTYIEQDGRWIQK